MPVETLSLNNLNHCVNCVDGRRSVSLPVSVAGASRGSSVDLLIEEHAPHHTCCRVSWSRSDSRYRRRVSISWPRAAAGLGCNRSEVPDVFLLGCGWLPPCRPAPPQGLPIALATGGSACHAMVLTAGRTTVPTASMPRVLGGCLGLGPAGLLRRPVQSTPEWRCWRQRER